MDAVTPAQPEKPANTLGEVRSKLRRAAQVAQLAEDPAADGYALLADLTDALDTTVTSLSASTRTVETAFDQVRQPFTQDILGPVQRAAAAGATEEVFAVARAIRWRTTALIGLGVGLAAAIAFFGGYAWGESNAARSFRVTEAGIAAAFQHGPKDAASWRDLMRWNDINDALRHCQPFTAQTSDRRACMVPLWTAPSQKRVPGA